MDGLSTLDVLSTSCGFFSPISTDKYYDPWNDNNEFSDDDDGSKEVYNSFSSQFVSYLEPTEAWKSLSKTEIDDVIRKSVEACVNLSRMQNPNNLPIWDSESNIPEFLDGEVASEEYCDSTLFETKPTKKRVRFAKVPKTPKAPKIAKVPNAPKIAKVSKVPNLKSQKEVPKLFDKTKAQKASEKLKGCSADKCLPPQIVWCQDFWKTVPQSDVSIEPTIVPDVMFNKRYHFQLAKKLASHHPNKWIPRSMMQKFLADDEWHNARGSVINKKNSKKDTEAFDSIRYPHVPPKNSMLLAQFGRSWYMMVWYPESAYSCPMGDCPNEDHCPSNPRRK
jgi:hypothetical protein